jgi:Ca2+-binding RTX toxin-like protein
MAVVSGNGQGNLAIWNLLSGTFQLTAAGSNSSTAINGSATLTATGSGFTYSGTILTGGSITAIEYTNGSSSQFWSGFSVSAAAAFNALAATDLQSFENLFFGGVDTLNYTVAGAGLAGFRGDDVFNIAGIWSASGSVDGGGGTDTLNLNGGATGILVSPGSVTRNTPNFDITNIETVKLSAGYDYILIAPNDLVASGKSLTVDGSALGASDTLIFNTDIGAPSFLGNIVLIGGAGNDSFQGGEGANLFNGGGGSDTVSFEELRSGVTVNLGIATAQSVGGGRRGTDTLTGIENLVGTAWNDVLTGDSGNNSLDGGTGGFDILNGGGGDDTLKGDLGNSTLDGGAGMDTAVFSRSRSSYTISHTGHTVTIVGPDGTDVLNSVEFARFADQTIQVAGPAMTTANIRVAANQILPLANLFSVTDFTGDPIIAYQLWDSTRDPNSGHFQVNGVAQAAATVINISAAQLAQTSFVTGSVNDRLQIRAFDGTSWSDADTTAWAPFAAGATANDAPAVTSLNKQASRHQSFAWSSLFQVNDGDGDAITRYQLWDSTRDPNSGHFLVNGAIQSAGTIIDITAADLAQTSFVAGTLSDQLQIRAFDGIEWSAADAASWAPFTVTVPNSAPVVTANNTARAHLQSYALSSLFSVNDADGDAVTKYQLWDSNRDPISGHFVVNGQVQAAGTVIDITAAQLSSTFFVTGITGDNLQIRAFDGIAWSAADTAPWSPFFVTAQNTAPAVSTGAISAMHGRSLALSTLFSVNDADSDAITRYQLWDSIRAPNSGHFEINGVAQAAGTVIDVSAAQLAQTVFVTGMVSDSLQIRALDGITWSASDTAPWAPFTVSVPAYTAPTVNTADVNTTASQTLALSALLQVNDADGDTMTRYQLWDSIGDPGSGHFVVNGVAKASNTVIDITAAQFSQTSFVTGTVADTLQVRAFDGISWSAADTAAWAPFHINVN